MPSEAQLKAQMQAAIAKKKKEQEAKSAPKPVSNVPQKPAVEPATKTPSSTKTPDPKPTAPPTPVIENADSAETEEVPHSVTFFGQKVRITLHKKRIYFAVEDLLPLSKNPDWQNTFIDFVNNPKTKKTADELIEVITFQSKEGSDKIPGSVAEKLPILMRELKFTMPGPLGRWLLQINQTFAE